MRDLLRQFNSIWQKIKPLQKMALLGVVISLALVLGLTMLKSGNRYSKLASSDEKEVKRFLEGSGVPFKEKRGNLLVASNQLDYLRDEIGLNKEDKGFELFDSNTWIKGERELQVLEMRALKGQLERDLTQFESIKNARVILDLAPSKKFGTSQYQTKASVILTLMPDAFLDDSQLLAITSHLAGAVRGLEPSNVAVSDTKGRLYKSIDDETKVVAKTRSQEQVRSVFEKMVGREYFLIEGERIFVDQALSNLEEVKQAAALFDDFELYPIPFQKQISDTKKSVGFFNLFFFLGMVSIALAIAFPFIRKRREKKLMRMATQVDMGILAKSLQDEDPEVVAWMLSYMEPKKAEKMVASFPEAYQEQLLLHLAELEKDQI